MQKVKKWSETLLAILSYPSIQKKINRITSNSIFVFPRFQTGGAEYVHLEIVKALKELNPVTIFSDLSSDKDLLKEFQKYSTVIYLRRWGWKTSFRKKMAKKLAKRIDLLSKPTIFGSNSEIFYDILPHLTNEYTAIDLLHTDLSNLPLSIENYARPTTHLLSTRVLLGEGHRRKIESFYLKNNIPKSELEKIKVIPNAVNIPEQPISKDFSKNFNVLFVGRNSYEKRPELFIEIAKRAEQQNLPFHFLMIGEFENFVDIAPNNLKIVGKLTDRQILNQYYENAHFIFLTSLFEGFPLVILEALAHGVIPVSTNVGEISLDINQSNLTGFIVENHGSEEQIVTSFLNYMKFFNTERHLLPHYSINGYNLVNKKFNKQQFIASYRTLLLPK